MKWFAEVVQDFDGTYSINLFEGGYDSCGKWHDPKQVNGIKEYVPYRELVESIREKTGISFVNRKYLHFTKAGRKSYAYVDATHYHPEGSCLLKYEAPVW